MIHVDVFPAVLSFAPADHPTPVEELRSGPPTEGSVQINSARVVLTHDRIIVARDGQGGPQIVYSQQIDPKSFVKHPDARMDSYILTVDGTKIAFKKDSQCGCGSRLKSWNPYKSIITAGPTQ